MKTYHADPKKQETSRWDREDRHNFYGLVNWCTKNRYFCVQHLESKVDADAFDQAIISFAASNGSKKTSLKKLYLFAGENFQSYTNFVRKNYEKIPFFVPQEIEEKRREEALLRSAKNKVKVKKRAKDRKISAADYVMTFGKYEGEKLGHILENNRQYLEWCLTTNMSGRTIQQIKYLLT